MEAAHNGTFSFGHTKIGMDAFWDTVIFSGAFFFPVVLLFLFIKVIANMKVDEIKKDYKPTEEDKNKNRNRMLISILILVICLALALITNK